LQTLKESVKSWRPRLQCAWIERQEAELWDLRGLLSFASARCEQGENNHKPDQPHGHLGWDG